MDKKIVRVRVAVAVDPRGYWNASGWSNADGKDMGIAVEGVNDGEARYWITADLPIPTVAEVPATVETE